MRHELHLAYRRVRVVPNACSLVGSPSAHGIVRVKCLAANGGSSKETYKAKSVRVSFLYTALFTSPTLAHFIAYTPFKTSRHPEFAGPPVKVDAETMRQLVNNDASLQIYIAVRVHRIP